MFDLLQARDQLSKWRLAGRPQGEVKISLSVLSELITAHSSGRVTSSPHTTSMPCEKTLRTFPSLLMRPLGVKSGTLPVPGALPAAPGVAPGASSALVAPGS